ATLASAGWIARWMRFPADSAQEPCAVARRRRDCAFSKTIDMMLAWRWVQETLTQEKADATREGDLRGTQSIGRDRIHHPAGRLSAAVLAAMGHRLAQRQSGMTFTPAQRCLRCFAAALASVYVWWNIAWLARRVPPPSLMIG